MTAGEMPREADLAAFLFGVLPVSAGWATKCFSKQAANSSQSDPSDLDSSSF